MSNPKPIFDVTGNHIQMHGEPAMHCSVSTARRHGIQPQLLVMSRAECKRGEAVASKAPEVVLFAADQPFSFDWRMTPAAARVLANNILQACDAADQVAAAQAGLRKAAKNRKALPGV